ncbi:MAG: hypothetical protein R8M45_06475 [Ghiorsea sp.]
MREEIIVQLETVLNATAGVSSVFRQFKALDSVSTANFPCVIIEEDMPESAFDYKHGAADIQFKVNLLCAVNTQQALATAINALDLLVKKAVAANPTMNGAATYCRILPETERSGTRFYPYGFVKRPILITYEGLPSAGY